MKVDLKSQTKLCEDGFENSNHRFLNMLANGLEQKVKTIVPEINSAIIGKTVQGSKINLVYTGEVVPKTEEEYDDIKNKIHNLINTLQNPTNLLRILKE